MPFKDNLCLLMHAQNVSSSRLAKALSVDTSLVSRWRKGTRTPGRNSGYIHEIAAYFVMHADLDYQKAALYELIGLRPDSKRKNNHQLISALENWLQQESTPDTAAFTGFFRELSRFTAAPAPMPAAAPLQLPKGQAVTSEIFYGIEGKRRGVLRFLALAAEQEAPRTLLLYSDEDMDWMIADRSFLEQWSLLLGKVIAKGNKIKIIHTVNRDLSEMLVAIERWLPLYMTGAIEPYYYPKYRPCVFRRTMFLLPDIAALTSECHIDRTEQAPNFLHTEPQLLASLQGTFQAYLELCRPLMRIITRQNPADILELLAEFDDQPGDFFYKANSPSFLSMPAALLEGLLQRAYSPAFPKEYLLDFHKKRMESFQTQLAAYSYTEIISLPSLENILGGRVLIPLSVLFADQTIYYTPDEFLLHIQNVLRLVQQYKNYNLYDFPNPLSGVNLTVKEDVGALITKGTQPPAIFAFNQLNMTDAFFSFMRNDHSSIPAREKMKKTAVKRLEECIAQLQGALEG